MFFLGDLLPLDSSRLLSTEFMTAALTTAKYLAYYTMERGGERELANSRITSLECQSHPSIPIVNAAIIDAHCCKIFTETKIDFSEIVNKETPVKKKWPTIIDQRLNTS